MTEIDPLPPRTRFFKNKIENPEIAGILDELSKYMDIEQVNHFIKYPHWHYGDDLIIKVSKLLIECYENREKINYDTANYEQDLNIEI